jgi:rhodanese-related sulfurtransferase
MIFITDGRFKLDKNTLVFSLPESPMLKKISLVLVMLAMTSLAVQAADIPSDPMKQTSWGLYLDAREAYEMKKASPEEVLFIDVRDPIEIMFVGYTDMVDVNIPFKLSNPSKWNEKKSVYAMEINPLFEQQVAEALTERGMDKSTPVIIMCRSGGTRGAPAVKLLEGKGYEKVYVVTDGFEGGKLKEGDKKGWRLKNGWKNAGLPWSYKLNKDKMYFRASN